MSVDYSAVLLVGTTKKSEYKKLSKGLRDILEEDSADYESGLTLFRENYSDSLEFIAVGFVLVTTEEVSEIPEKDLLENLADFKDRCKRIGIKNPVLINMVDVH